MKSRKAQYSHIAMLKSNVLLESRLVLKFGLGLLSYYTIQN